MEKNRLEVLQQQVEASQSLLQQMTEQVSALNSELLAMRQELMVLSEAVLCLKDEEEAVEAHEHTEEPLELLEEPLKLSEEPLKPSEEPLEDFHDISEEEVRLIETSEAMAAEPVVKSDVPSVADSEETLTIAERFGQEKQAGNLNERFVNRFKASLSRSMSLNDRFRFQRELFHGSQAEMNDSLSNLECCSSFDEAWDYVCHKLDGELIADEGNEAMQDFRHVLELHFS